MVLHHHNITAMLHVYVYVIKNMFFFRVPDRSDPASARQRDSSEEQQPAGDHRGVGGRRHRCRCGHRGSHLHAPFIRATKEVSPFFRVSLP